jgi:hypothetical protein
MLAVLQAVVLCTSVLPEFFTVTTQVLVHATVYSYGVPKSECRPFLHIIEYNCTGSTDESFEEVVAVHSARIRASPRRHRVYW